VRHCEVDLYKQNPKGWEKQVEGKVKKKEGMQEWLEGFE